MTDSTITGLPDLSRDVIANDRFAVDPNGGGPTSNATGSDLLNFVITGHPTIYTANSTLTGDRIVDLDVNNLLFTSTAGATLNITSTQIAIGSPQDLSLSATGLLQIDTTGGDLVLNNATDTIDINGNVLDIDVTTATTLNSATLNIATTGTTFITGNTGLTLSGSFVAGLASGAVSLTSTTGALTLGAPGVHTHNTTTGYRFSTSTSGYFTIGATATGPLSGAIFSVKSTSKGVSFPGGTTTERNAIVSPAESLLFYDTTDGEYYYYDGSAWIPLSNGAGINNIYDSNGTLTSNRTMSLSNFSFLINSTYGSSLSFQTNGNVFLEGNAFAQLSAPEVNVQAGQALNLSGGNEIDVSTDTFTANIVTGSWLSSNDLLLKSFDQKIWLQPQNATAGVSIAASSDAIDSSAILKVSSTTRGVMLPRGTTAQRNAIATPAASLIFYDTNDNEYYYYNGTSWLPMSTGGSGNIYDSNGTLTGDRTLTGATNDLTFSSLGIFTTSGSAFSQTFGLTQVNASAYVLDSSTTVTVNSQNLVVEPAAENTWTMSTSSASNLAINIDAENTGSGQGNLNFTASDRFIIQGTTACNIIQSANSASNQTLTISSTNSGSGDGTFLISGGDGGTVQVVSNSATPSRVTINSQNTGGGSGELYLIAASVASNAVMVLNSDTIQLGLTGCIVDMTNASGGAVLPNWTTANRPGSPLTGHIGFNLTLSRGEYWDGAAWQQF